MVEEQLGRPGLDARRYPGLLASVCRNVLIGNGTFCYLPFGVNLTGQFHLWLGTSMSNLPEMASIHVHTFHDKVCSAG